MNLDISPIYTLLFLSILFLIFAALFFILKAKKMIAGYRANFMNAVISSFLILSAGIMFHFIREQVFEIDALLVLEHSFILVGFLYLLRTGMNAMRNKEVWGIT